MNPFYNFFLCLKIAGLHVVANSVEPDQTQCSVVSDVDLCGFLRPVY